MKKRENKAQITIFVIVALIIIAGIVGFVLIKNNFYKEIPKDIGPIYDYYKSCVAGIVQDGSRILGSQGGYIEQPDFSPGSQYAPFSSHLDFLGSGIPYWYYLSGNGLVKEAVPSKKQMEVQLADYMKEEIEKCNLNSFKGEGFNIEISKASAKAEIKEDKIITRITQKMIFKREDSSFSVTNHVIEIDSKIGKYYNLAKKIYDYQKKNMFLENYSADVLHTYAPVEGVEITCSPKIWSPYEVFDKLKQALEANIQALRINGDYYEDVNPYFIVGKGSDLSVNNMQVNFLYSRDWPSRFEVWPSKNNLMIADPIGTQQGLGVLGFCYAPYKFVYDMYFPVLIQIYNSDGDEIFQFPFAVVIDKNMPREASGVDFIEVEESICDNSNTNITVSTYDAELNAIGTDLRFKCITDSCRIGRTVIDNSTDVASVSVAVPQCANGVIVANADGYKEKKYIISTNVETSADIILTKEYPLLVEVYVDNVKTNELSVLTVNEINEDSTDFIKSVSYPYNKELGLGEGYYKFELKVYKQGTVTVPEITKKQCFETPKTGILGLLGFEEEKCVDITIPSQKVDNLIYAGGYLEQYITEDELESSNIIRIYAESVKTPGSIEDLQEIYDTIEIKKINVELA